ncbi:MAG: phytoene desaturase family protein [Vicinamibacterales bacterium]
MNADHDVIVIGGGVNGLVAAAVLARSGLRTLILERGATCGGGAVTHEIAPGFLVPRYTHQAGPFRRDVSEALDLEGRGVAFVDSEVDVTALATDGRAITIFTDDSRTVAGLAGISPGDAARWPAFAASRRAVAGVIASLLEASPPPLDAPDRRELWQLVKTAHRFRRLERADAYRLLRWAPMPVADLLREHFESDLLMAGLAGDAVFGAMLGPQSAGSGMTFLLRAANDVLGGANRRFMVGGPGRLAEALIAVVKDAGGQVRTGSEVSRVRVDDEGRVLGVTLASGEELDAMVVVSGLDPRRTLLSLVDPVHLGPELVWRLGHYRVRGTVAKVNLALGGLPAFTGVATEQLTGRIRLGATLEALERAFDHAKYGRFSPEPWIELTLPSLVDASLAPGGAHVLSAYVQWAPYQLRSGSWDAAREALGDAVLTLLDRYAPGLSRLIVAREVLTPLDLERELGMTGGHIFHGELALDQLLTMRPMLGLGGYRTPVDGLFLCGSGTHPGTGLTGGSGWLAARVIANEFTQL